MYTGWLKKSLKIFIFVLLSFPVPKFKEHYNKTGGQSKYD